MMKEKTKYLLGLLAVLLLGIVIGFLINGRITSVRISRMQNSLTEQGFNRAFFRMIKPTPDQVQVLKPLFKKFARQNRQRLINFHDAQRDAFNRFQKQITPYLTQEQVYKIEHFKNRQERRFFRLPMKRRGPPPRFRN